MNPKVKIKYPRKCANKRCRGFVVTERSKNVLCPKCRIRRWNEKNPLARAFHNLRSHAKERGKDFSLTFEQFKAFAEKTDYMKRKGKTSISLSIDRVDDSLGYHYWNVQALTLRENSRKQWVPYFNGGHMPDKSAMREARDVAENGYEKIVVAMADEIAENHAPGTPEFWTELNKQKKERFDNEN